MASVNRIFLIGHVGKNPELRQSMAGKAVCSFSLAVSEKRQGKDATEWFKVTTFNKTAEVVSEYVKKGSSVYVEGRLQTSTWTDKEGKERTTLEVVANDVRFLDKKGGERRDERTAKKNDDGFDDSDLPF